MFLRTEVYLFDVVEVGREKENTCAAPYPTPSLSSGPRLSRASAKEPFGEYKTDACHGVYAICQMINFENGLPMSYCPQLLVIRRHHQINTFFLMFLSRFKTRFICFLEQNGSLGILGVS